MSTLKVNSLQPANAGVEDYAVCRAWVSYHQPTPQIRGSFRVSSVTDSANARAIVNFSVTMSTATYANPTQQNQAVEFYSYGSTCGTEAKSTTSIQFYNRRPTTHDAFDFGILNVAIFGDIA